LLQQQTPTNITVNYNLQETNMSKHEAIEVNSTID